MQPGRWREQCRGWFLQHHAYGKLILALVGLFMVTAAWAVTNSFTITVNVFQLPGPSQVLYSQPYYTCSTNRYVATAGNGGSDAADGTTATVGGGHGPWLTIQHADAAVPSAGWCINVGPGTYAAGVVATHGGNAATSSGYVVYRCGTAPNDYSNMDQCVITDPSGGGGAAMGTYTTNYLIFDGFELASSNSNTSFAGGFQASESQGNGGGTITAHHLWFMNSKVHGYGQAGVQGGRVDFVYVIHNEIYDNSHSNTCPGPQGSGISIYQPTKLAAYSYTADDKSNSVLGNMAYQGDFFRMVFAWNHIHNNYINTACAPGITDGDGIIFDDWASSQGTGGGNVVYAAHGLAMFNVVYNNGSYGIHLFSDTNTGACPSGGGHVVANNSVYNNSNYTGNDSTQGYRFDIDEVQSGCNLFVNNISYTISTAGLTNPNTSLVSAMAGGSYAASTFDHNIVVCTGANNSGSGSCPSPIFGAIDASTATFTNITVADPQWTAEGNVSTGSFTTAPNGINFALTGGSPAIGFLVSETFLPSGTRDAGACDHVFTTCP